MLRCVSHKMGNNVSMFLQEGTGLAVEGSFSTWQCVVYSSVWCVCLWDWAHYSRGLCLMDVWWIYLLESELWIELVWICSDEREVDSPPSAGQSGSCSPWRASGCHGGGLGSASPGTGTTSAPPTGEYHSLGHSWACVGVRETGSEGIGGTQIVRRRYVTGKVRKASTFPASEFPKLLFH